MGETASQIENHIEDRREALGLNLRELEDKVKSVTDWRRQFQSRPLVLLSLAFGGGVLLAKIAGSSSRSRRYTNDGSKAAAGPDSHRLARRASSPTIDKAFQTWENIKGALVGIAATRVKAYADEIIPGFSEHYQKAKAEQRR